MLPSVLCLDSGKTAFQASRLLCMSGMYRVFTATNTAAAMSVISATDVDACVVCEDIQDSEHSVALLLANACPEVPAVVFGAVPRLRDGVVRRRLTFLHDPATLTQRLDALIAENKAGMAKAKTLLRTSRELREKSIRLRRDNRQLLERALAKLNRSDREQP